MKCVFDLSRRIGATSIVLLAGLSLSAASAAGQSADSTYLPLQVGNSWTMAYILDPPFEPWDTVAVGTFEIAGTAIVNANEYTLLSHHLAFADTIRAAADGNIYALTNGIEQLLFDFTADGDSAYTFAALGYEAPYQVSVKKGMSVQTFVGTFDNCISFAFDVPESIDEEIGYTFAPGVGLVAFSGAWEYGWLVQGKVGERIYITGVDDAAKIATLDPLSVFPNPVSTDLNLVVTSERPGRVRVSVFDIQGRTIRSFEAVVSQGSNTVKVDAAGLAAGVYALRVVPEDHKSSARTTQFVVAKN